MQPPASQALLATGGVGREAASSWKDSWKSQWKQPQRKPWNKWQNEAWKKNKPEEDRGRPAASYNVKEATPEEIRAAAARKSAAEKAETDEITLEDEDADDGEYLKALWESANTAAWAATDRPLSARELVEKGQLEPWWKYPWYKIAAKFSEASECKSLMAHLSVPDAVAGRMATIMAAFRHYGRPLEGDGDLAQKVGPEMLTFDVPGQNVLFVGCNIKGPSFVHDANYASQATMCHGTSFASVIGVAQCGEITVGDNREDGFPADGFSARGALVGYSKDSMVAAVKKTASRAKSLGGAMLVVEAELPGPTPQVEGGHDYLHSACRDAGSVRSGEHFLLSPKHVVLRGIAVGWPR